MIGVVSWNQYFEIVKEQAFVVAFLTTMNNKRGTKASSELIEMALGAKSLCENNNVFFFSRAIKCVQGGVLALQKLRGATRFLRKSRTQMAQAIFLYDSFLPHTTFLLPSVCCFSLRLWKHGQFSYTMSLVQADQASFRFKGFLSFLFFLMASKHFMEYTSTAVFPFLIFAWFEFLFISNSLLG